MEKLKYTSAKGYVIELDGPDIFSGFASALRASRWSYGLGQNTLQYSRRGAAEVSVNVQMLNSNKSEIIAAFDSDVQSLTPGTFEVDGWTQRGYVVGFKPVSGFYSYVQATLQVVLLDGIWIRKKLLHFEPNSGQTLSTDGLDYPTDYSYDLQLDESLGKIITVGSGGCLLGIRFFGPCSSPYVRVGSNTYGVSASVPSGSRIIIDPLGINREGESIYSVGQWGERANLFDKRIRGASGSGTYIFERLPEGQHLVTWPQSFGLDLELIEEAGTPPWN